MSRKKSISTKKQSSPIEKELKVILEQNKLAHKRLKENSKVTMNLLKNLINKTPEVLAIRWSQYIPGFNDGAPCEFSVNELEIKFDDSVLPITKEDINTDDGFLNGYELDSFFAKKEDIINFEYIEKIENKVKLMVKVHEALSDMKEGLEETFGSNTEITLTRSGVTQETYDCGY